MIASIYLLVFNSLIVPSALMGLHFPHSCFSISYLCKPSDKVVVIKSEVVLDKNHVIDISPCCVALAAFCIYYFRRRRHFVHSEQNKFKYMASDLNLFCSLRWERLTTSSKVIIAKSHKRNITKADINNMIFMHDNVALEIYPCLIVLFIILEARCVLITDLLYL